jgi:hypothetical protein
MAIGVLFSLGRARARMNSWWRWIRAPEKQIWRDAGVAAERAGDDEVSSNGPPIGTWSTPLVIEHGKRKEVVMPFDFRFGAYDREKWEVDLGKSGLGLQTYVTPLWTDGMVIAHERQRRRWRFVRRTRSAGATGQNRNFDLVRDRDEKHLFYLAENGLAECWEKETGKVLWQERLQGPGKKRLRGRSLPWRATKFTRRINRATCSCWRLIRRFAC